MPMIRSGVAVCAFAFAVVLSAPVQALPISVKIGQSVYQAGAPGDVVFSIESWTSPRSPVSGELVIKPLPQRNRPVTFKASFSNRLGAVTWNKKDSSGVYAQPGNYHAAFTLRSAKRTYYFARTFALTQTGRIAGNEYFPITPKNDFEFLAQGSDRLARGDRVTIYRGDNGWQKIGGGLLDRAETPSDIRVENRRVQMRRPGTAAPVDVFRLDGRLGDTFSVNVPGLLENATLKVGATDAVVFTPLGKFTGCTRLDVVRLSATERAFGAFWFAPGFGLVQYSSRRVAIGQPSVPWSVLQVWRATIVGSDGTNYDFGGTDLESR